MPVIETKRAYDPPAPEDGTRILVDRYWPRGVSRKELAVDGWQAEIAPSEDLRKWFDHDPAKWAEFRRRYHEELDRKTEPVEALLEAGRTGTLTLVYAARDTEHNNAVALRSYLLARAGQGRDP